MTAQAPSWVTHQQRGDSGDHRVQHGRRDDARVLGSEVGFRVRGLVAEEALHVHVERVRVLEVVCQHDRPRHDHQLEIKHGRQRVGQEHLPTIQWRTSKHLSSRYSSRISPGSDAPSAREVGTRRGTRSHGTAIEPEWESAREESTISATARSSLQPADDENTRQAACPRSTIIIIRSEGLKRGAIPSVTKCHLDSTSPD